MALVVLGLWILMLFGFAACAVDVSRIYTERAEPQNGANGAVLAVGVDCGLGLCDGFYDGVGATEP